MARRWPACRPRHDTSRAEARPALAAARALLAAETGASAPPPDWATLAATSEAERLGAWLYALGRAQRVPAARLEALRPAWLAFRRQHVLAVHELGALLDAFEHARLPVIPLKGPVLAEALYRDPAGRPLTDLDLLVPPAEVDRAVELLTRLGYRHLGHDRTLAYERASAGAACFVPEAASPRHLPVDLHWTLVSFPGGFVPAGLRDPGVWARARRVERLGRPVLQLDDDDLLLYLALHLAVHHPLSGLRWRLELSVCLARGGARGDALVARARAWGVAGALYFALVATARSLAVAPPATVVAAARPAGVRGRLLERLASTAGERPRLEYLVNLLSLDRGVDRRRLLRRAMAPPASWVRARYGRRSALRAWCEHYGRAASVLRTR